MNKILPKEITNNLYYAYKRNNWMVDFSRYYKKYIDLNLNSPIFLLGLQGGGLSLVSRMLRRNDKVVSVTGDSKYWTGADELQNVLGPILPPEFTGIKHKVPPHPEFDKPRGWLYATDELIDKYRLTSENVNEENKEKYINILKWTIYRQAKRRDVRFTDKSQINTVKVSFLDKVLSEYNPKFILITRDPYALCFRSAQGKAYSLKRLQSKYSFHEILELASQHWANSIKAALEDGENMNNFKILKFEDILSEPQHNMKEICDFANLEYSEDMLPQPNHVIPFGSKRKNRWYPLKPKLNNQYLNEITKEEIEIIDKHCGKYASLLGYERPDARL
ncbi:sulfotransferase family protein [Halobacillus massiliensis]|uniref:sulfotransferase family protein n=1 Tax=Halobacillus massiliensis TaxID=1926286 RepID=UPI0009E3A6C5|nr:sulfotransferase [Halobacillus massiliensis]